jgi:hypothetical protein
MKNCLIYLTSIAAIAVLSAAPLAAGPIASQIVFLEYVSANGPALNGNLTGEYNFRVYAATQDGSGNLVSGSLLYDIALWCLTPFASTNGGKVAFAVGNGSDIGQLHDVSGVSDAEADSFYRDTTAMYQYYYSIGNTSLRDDLQASIWERRDMIEGPAGTESPNSFNLSNGNYHPGTPGQISQYTLFSGFIPSNGIIGNIFTPIYSTDVPTGDIQFGAYQYNYNHDKQEFGYVVPVPEPTSLLLLGGGMVAAAALLRRKKFTSPR